MSSTSSTPNLNDYNFSLPPELIAQQPMRQRAGCRLMLINRKTGAITHHHFSELPALLQRGDLLVYNNTKVIPARLFGKRQTGGKVEVLLNREIAGGQWETLLKPAAKIQIGNVLTFSPTLSATVTNKLENGLCHLRFPNHQRLLTQLKRIGHIPLPPYIHRPDTARDRAAYQTVFAQKPGAVAAPTAGLHFTPALLKKLKAAGVAQTAVTLHVGLGTFQPLREESLRQGKLHPEHYAITSTAEGKIRTTKQNGGHRHAGANGAGRIVAVGTTVVRTLEHAARQGRITAGSGETEIFITPGFEFQIVDALITNFHLPRSSLLLLVSAFGGHDLIRRAYREAIQKCYRFYSYGDAMLIV